MSDKTFTEVADYILANDATCRTWPSERFERWLRFHWNEGFVCLVLDFDESIAAVVLIRPVMVEDAHDPLQWDQEGNCLHIAQVVATRKHAMTALGFAVLKRFGQRDYVSWHRPPDFQIRIHKSSVLRRNLFRRMEAIK